MVSIPRKNLHSSLCCYSADLTCPACRKHNPDANCCTRCGAGLLPLVLISQTAQQALEEGGQYLQRRRSSDALRAAEHSWQLKHTPEATGLAFPACLHQQQFDAATRWYRRVQLAKLKIPTSRRSEPQPMSKRV